MGNNRLPLYSGEVGSTILFYNLKVSSLGQTNLFVMAGLQ